MKRMMQWFRDMPISKKLRLIITVTAGIALLLEFAASAMNNWTLQRQRTIEQLTAQAKIIGASSTAALAFNDRKAAEETLGVLRNVPAVEYGVLFARNGSVFARYLREVSKERALPDGPLKEGHHFGRGLLTVSQNIALDNEQVGTVVIQSDLRHMYSLLARNFIIVALVTVAAAVIVLLLSSIFERIISQPLLHLSELMNDISKRKDYAVRARKYGEDEIGQLADSFNTMIVDLQNTTVSRDYVDSIFKNMIDSLIVIGPDGSIKTVNRSTCDLLGYREDELIGEPVHKIFAEDIPMGDLEMAENVEGTYLSKDGRKIPVLFSTSGMTDERGQASGIVCVASDITERKLHEKEREAIQLKMLTTSKLASLGEIATGIAHEINQPLTYINSFIQGLQINLEDKAIDEKRLEERLKVSYNQIQRIREIVQHLQTFGSKDDIVMQSVSLEKVLYNTLLLMGERIRLRDINQVKNIATDLPRVSGNPTRLEQVFINLLQNSIDAFPAGSEDAMIKVEVLVSEGRDFLIVKITDNGKGIEKKNLERIFEPFFTTKNTGEGTGIGLSIVYGIIREHNGTIICESDVTKGTVFTIKLPVEPDARK